MGALMNRARVVLVGTGRMGQVRASLMYSNPRFDLAGVVDVDVAAAEALADKYQAKPFNNLTEAVDHFGAHGSVSTDFPADNRRIAHRHLSSSIDGVVISSPTFTHDAIIREAARKGLFVFTEKPVDETAEQIKRMFDICTDAKVNLCCGFQRRFDSNYVAAAAAVHRGEIGTPLTSSIFFGDHPCPPLDFLLTGGNIFSDLSAHDVDYIRWVLKDEVASVYATGTSSKEVLEENGIHDNATMVMKFRRGAVVTLTMSRSACYGYDQRCEIFGDNGLVQVGNEHTHGSTLSNVQGVQRSILKHSFPERFKEAFAAELDAFADTVLMGTPWPVSAADCIAVQKVSDAARVSCELNRVVEIFDDESTHEEVSMG